MSGSWLEKQRLKALRNLGILDTPPEERFEKLTKIARRFYNVEIAMFTLVDEHRQWFKSKQGLDVDETPRSMAFCDHTIQQDKILIVEDAQNDPRFHDNPLVTGSPHIRFYAGMPVREPSGFKIGTLCIIDPEPRAVAEFELDVLRTLASLVEDELENAYVRGEDHEYVKISELSRSIHRAQNIFLTHEDQGAAFELMLNDLLVLTSSQFGFIGEVLHHANGDPYLKVGAITNLAWNAETEALYQQVQRRGMTFENLDNLIGSSLLSGEM
ncbi:MAG: sensory box/GGDEF/GAF/EAL domain protein [Marinobacter sp. T13-3]|nr:MAG: sensory box/GGDEF/GAF/EAL domain protein [Marinobacter sp. T13-3]